MSRPPKSKVTPHVFTPDPDVPADHTGRQACRCGLVGEPNDTHHTMPEVPEQAESRRRAGDDE